MTSRRTNFGQSGGFTIIEVLIAMMIITIALVAIVGMFPQGYRQVIDAGRLTLGVATARQILEDMRTVPFNSLTNLNGFDSQNPATIPATEPEMGIATRWQNDFPAGDGQAIVQVDDCGNAANPCGLPAPNAGLRQIRVTVSVTALTQTVQLTTLFARMF
jgi:prepilin-type N-terminal cleavage/methylation domain-containing protein